MILFQVKDLAAKRCGEPHIAPSWEIAKASLGALLAKTPELADRAHSIRIELCGLWDPSEGVKHTLIADIPGQAYDFGDVCLTEFRAACAKEEYEKQEEADNEQ